MKTLSMTIKIKATEQYFPAVFSLLVILYTVALTFVSVDKIFIQMKTIQTHFPVKLLFYQVLQNEHGEFS